MEQFLNIHTHSTSSTRDGLAKIEDMVEISKNRNELFALTDHGSIQGWMKYYIEAKKAGIKPIFGIETYINPYRDELMDVLDKIKKQKKGDKDRSLNKKRDELSQQRMHLILIAKNIIGFYNIIQIANDAYVNGFYSKQLTNYELINKYKEGIIVTTACIAGPLNKFAFENDMDSAIIFVNNMKKYFGDDFYLEVQVNEMKEQVVYNSFIIKLSEKTKTKMLCGIDSHYTEKSDNIAHQDLLLIQNGNKAKDVGKKDIKITYENKKGEKKVKRVNPDKSFEFKKDIDYRTLKVGDTVNKETILSIEEVNRVWQFEANSLYFKSKDELIEILNNSELSQYTDKIIKNHYDLNKKIENFDINTENKLPHIDNAEKIISNYCSRALRKLKDDGKLLTKPTKYVERLQFELSVINDNGFATYFLILADIIKYCKKHLIAIGAGRGSAVSSLVSYLLEITRIDPLDPRWGNEGLPFERFLSSQRNASIVTVNNGDEELKFYDFEKINIIRDKIEIQISAIELKEDDQIILS